MCDLASVLYWGDGALDKIEKANLDGTGRTILLQETDGVRYFKFNEISSEAGQMASIPGYTIVSRNTFQYTMI